MYHVVMYVFFNKFIYIYVCVCIDRMLVVRNVNVRSMCCIELVVCTIYILVPYVVIGVSAICK